MDAIDDQRVLERQVFYNVKSLEKYNPLFDLEEVKLSIQKNGHTKEEYHKMTIDDHKTRYVQCERYLFTRKFIWRYTLSWNNNT